MTIHIEEYLPLFKDEASLAEFVDSLKKELASHDMITIRAGNEVLGHIATVLTHGLMVRDLMRYHEIMKTPLPVNVTS